MLQTTDRGQAVKTPEVAAAVAEAFSSCQLITRCIAWTAVGTSPASVATLIREVHASRRQGDELLLGAVLLLVLLLEEEDAVANFEAEETVSPEEEKVPEAIASDVRQAHLKASKACSSWKSRSASIPLLIQSPGVTLGSKTSPLPVPLPAPC